jgi:hypothetical protein
MSRPQKHLDPAPGEHCGSWIFLEELPTTRESVNKHVTRWFRCKCVRCGTESSVRRIAVVTRDATHCYNCRPLNLRVNGYAKKVDGVYVRSEYGIWSGIHRRCNDLKNKHYGARGIKVAPEWHGSEGFLRFLEYIGPRPSKKHSVDRINPNGDYAPGNVRWATPKEQGRNRRNNRLLTFEGVAKTITEWAEQRHCSDTLIINRLKWGWSVEAALSVWTCAAKQVMHYREAVIQAFKLLAVNPQDATTVSELLAETLRSSEMRASTRRWGFADTEVSVT